MATGEASGLPAAVSDPDRLAAVAASGLLDSGPESAFDDLTRLALALTGAAQAYFTVVDERRSYWKSAIGADVSWGRSDSVAESPCQFLIDTGRALIVEDAPADPRLRDLGAIRAPGIGAWAGYPVFAPGGQVLGGFCVADARPREFTQTQREGLQTLARAASTEVALRHALLTAQANAYASGALARTLQESLLPPRLAAVAGLDVHAVYVAADVTGAEVVGDFYDLFPTGGRDWCAVMGDVCGKGVEAAKVTAQARYTVRAEAVHQTRPAKILRRLQEALVDQQISDRFLSAVLVIFQHSADGLNARLSNAGHPPALIRRADGSVEAVDCPGSILSPMIQSQDIRLGEVRLRLSPGDALLLYTDGITEARNGPGQPLFGEDRLAATLAETAGMEADSTLEHLRQAMVNHAKGSANDDTALMLIRVLPVG